MLTQTQKPGTQLKQTITKTEKVDRQERLAAAIKSYIANCTDLKRHPCAALMGELFGGHAHMAGEVMDNMRYAVIDLLVLLTDPDVAKAFQKIKGVNTLSGDHTLHLQRLCQFLDWANNDLCHAEMALYDVESYTLDDLYLHRLEEVYGSQTA